MVIIGIYLVDFIFLKFSLIVELLWIVCIIYYFNFVGCRVFDDVIFCIFLVGDNGDVIVYIYYILMEVYCLENDIKLLKVGFYIFIFIKNY